MGEREDQARELVRARFAEYLDTPGVASTPKPGMAAWMAVEAIGSVFRLVSLDVSEDAEENYRRGFADGQAAGRLPVLEQVLTRYLERGRRAAEGEGDPFMVEVNYYAALGHASVVAAVDRFYDRVLDDDRVSHHFAKLSAEQVDRLKQHQVAMFSQVLGGPKTYEGRTLREAHRHLGITDDQFDVVADHLTETLAELGVSREPVAYVAWVLQTLRDDVVST